MYVSQNRISVSDEDAVIIPTGYVAPAYLDETFEEEQRTVLEKAIIQAMKDGLVTYSSNETKEAVNTALENGGSVEIEFYISESITKSKRLYYLDEEVVNVLDNKIGNKQKLTAYYQVIIFIYVNGSYVGEVTELSMPISITIPYPNGVPALSNGYKRVWRIIRYHEGETDILDAKQTKDGISFKNDKFSTFALVYEDIKVDKTSNPPTGDNIITYVIMLGLGLLGVIGAGIYAKKKIFNKNKD